MTWLRDLLFGSNDLGVIPRWTWLRQQQAEQATARLLLGAAMPAKPIRSVFDIPRDPSAIARREQRMKGER